MLATRSDNRSLKAASDRLLNPRRSALDFGDIAASITFGKFTWARRSMGYAPVKYNGTHAALSSAHRQGAAPEYGSNAAWGTALLSRALPRAQLRYARASYL
jgi:hypothetical protein